MTNLLPQDYIKSFRNNYRLRLATTALWGTFAALIAGSVFLLPALQRSRGLMRGMAAELTILKEQYKKLSGGTEGAIAANLTRKMELLRLKQNSSQANELMAQALTHRNEGIDIDLLTYEAKQTGDEIKIGGVSATREELINFINALKQDQTFVKADLPIEYLASEEDIEFTITLALAPPA